MDTVTTVVTAVKAYFYRLLGKAFPTTLTAAQHVEAALATFVTMAERLEKAVEMAQDEQDAAQDAAEAAWQAYLDQEKKFQALFAAASDAEEKATEAAKKIRALVS